MVVWARHIRPSIKVEIRQESTLRTFSVVEMDHVHFRLGETVNPARKFPPDQTDLTSTSQGSDEPIGGKRGWGAKSVPGWSDLLPISMFSFPAFTRHSGGFSMVTDRC